MRCNKLTVYVCLVRSLGRIVHVSEWYMM